MYVVRLLDATNDNFRLFDQYLVRAGSQVDALKAVNLTAEDVDVLNQPYQGHAFLRYTVEVEEVKFNEDGVYFL